jgi:hypothetical protein
MTQPRQGVLVVIGDPRQLLSLAEQEYGPDHSMRREKVTMQWIAVSPLVFRSPCFALGFAAYLASNIA